MSSKKAKDGKSDGYIGNLDDLDLSEEDPFVLGEDEYVDTEYLNGWFDAERARQMLVTKIDGIDSVADAARRRALPPAQEGDDV